MRFKGKVVIVTGGASGIGLCSVQAFAKEGAKVVIADFSLTGQNEVEQLESQGVQALFIQTDVAEVASVQAMVAKVIEHFGRVDILFANAGIANDNVAADLSVDAWRKTIDINLSGVFYCDQAVIQHWMKVKSAGVIVNCGSIHSFVGKSAVTAYAASKGGVKLMTQTLATDYAKHNIRINAVCPGYIDTPLLSQMDAQHKAKLIALHPQGRLGRVQEVAAAVLFLASDDASFVNGASLLVDGGYTAQ